jgi:hypothetical protein
MEDSDYSICFGAGVFYALLAWGALRSRRTWLKNLLNYALAGMIGLILLAMVIPNHVHARIHRCSDVCLANLKQIEGATAVWASEHNQADTAIPQDSDLFGEANYIRIKPTCPSAGTYKLGSVREKPTCSVKGHQLDAPPRKEPRISKETWARISGLGSGAGTVAVAAPVLAAWRRWRGRSGAPPVRDG